MERSANTMQRMLGAVKAAYNFIAGDPIILSLVAAAFIVTAALEYFLPAQQLVAGVVFVALIALGLILTLGRERISARRARRAQQRA